MKYPEEVSDWAQKKDKLKGITWKRFFFRLWLCWVILALCYAIDPAHDAPNWQGWLRLLYALHLATVEQALMVITGFVGFILGSWFDVFVHGMPWGREKILKYGWRSFQMAWPRARLWFTRGVLVFLGTYVYAVLMRVVSYS